MDLFHQIAGTILLRPYFVAFFLAYFFACTLHLGLKRAFLFAIAGYCIAWAAEYSSIHNGIPYGLYYYIPRTQRVRELWVLGIPFMDSMSFVFLSYASYSLALFALSRRYKGRRHLSSGKQRDQAFHKGTASRRAFLHVLRRHH